MPLVDTRQIENLKVRVYDDATEMGEAASAHVALYLKDTVMHRKKANLLLATGASQFAFLDALKKDPSIEWKKITVFHLDEYLNLSDQHPASFRKYLKERILDEVNPKKVYFLNGDAGDIDSEIERYEALLKEHPIDVACIGIGENGHLAFNDPPVADFEDPKLVKVVELDKACRRQQLGEGWFDSLDDVPTHALSMTIPAIMNSKQISCVVPDERKAEAVHKALFGPVTTDCPASILRQHDDTVLFLDKGSARKLKSSR